MRIPAIGQALAREGLAEPRSLSLGQLFGRDSIGMSQEDRNTRVRLVRQIAVPVALGLLATCENPDLRGANFSCSLGDFFEPDPVADAAAAESGTDASAQAVAGFLARQCLPRARNRPPCAMWRPWCARILHPEL